MFRLVAPLLVAVVFAAGPALAADGAKPQPMRVIVQPPKPADDAGLRPAIRSPGSTAPQTIALPPPIASGLTGGSLAANGLSSGGLRSGLPAMGDPAGQCRTVCTRARFTCNTLDGGPDCGARWAMCTANCGH